MFLTLLAMNTLFSFLTLGLSSWISRMILKAPLSFKIWIFYTAIASLVSSLSGSLLTLNQIEQQGYFEGPVMLLISLNTTIIYLVYSKILFPKTSRLQLLLLFCLTQTFIAVSDYLLLFLLKISGIYAPLFDYSKIMANILQVFLAMGTAILFSKLAEKKNWYELLLPLLEYKTLSIVIIILFYIVTSWIDLVAESNPTAIFFIFFCYFLLSIAIMYVVAEITKREKLRLSNKLIQQQEIYSKHLEQAQTEISTVHKRYERTIQTLYKHSLSNETKEIKQIIQKDVLQIDQAVTQNLKQMNQLGNIELVELKGLILAKILEGKEKQLELFVEVKEPVKKIKMPVKDLLRCIGILLDNAIEEAMLTEQQAITLILLQEEDNITIVVKNPFTATPDLSQIWNEGYSTKGEHRGLGLSSLRQIISLYQNVFQDTRIEQNQFVQILMINN